jgi:exonuclease III
MIMRKRKWKVHMGILMGISVLCVMFYLMQWNARSLVANGQEFKQMLDGLEEKPELICIEETWLKPRLDFRIPGHKCERRDRESTAGGGCATFIKNGVQYRRMEMDTVLECVVTEVWTDRGEIAIVHLYNPCIKLEEIHFQEILDRISEPMVWVGDFNAHNELWGSKKRNRNGKIVEEFIDKKQLVVLNDGRPTWFRTSRTGFSSIDITIASAELALISRWETMDLYTMGSDHVPIICKFGICLIEEPVNLSLRLNYKRVNWLKFEEDVHVGLSLIDRVREKG